MYNNNQKYDYFIINKNELDKYVSLCEEQKVEYKVCSKFSTTSTGEKVEDLDNCILRLKVKTFEKWEGIELVENTAGHIQQSVIRKILKSQKIKITDAYTDEVVTAEHVLLKMREAVENKQLRPMLKKREDGFILYVDFYHELLNIKGASFSDIAEMCTQVFTIEKANQFDIFKQRLESLKK